MIEPGDQGNIQVDASSSQPIEVDRGLHFGIGLPGANAAGKDCLEWIQQFMSTYIVSISEAEKKFDGIDKDVALGIANRVRHWQHRDDIASYKTKFDSFMQVLHNAASNTYS